jgi:hypothetical protein
MPSFAVWGVKGGGGEGGAWQRTPHATCMPCQHMKHEARYTPIAPPSKCPSLPDLSALPSAPPPPAPTHNTWLQSCIVIINIPQLPCDGLLLPMPSICRVQPYVPHPLRAYVTILLTQFHPQHIHPPRPCRCRVRTAASWPVPRLFLLRSCRRWQQQQDGDWCCVDTAW